MTDFTRPPVSAVVSEHPSAATWSRRSWLTGAGAAALTALLSARSRAEEKTSSIPTPLRPIGIFSHIVPGDHHAKAQALRAAGFTCVQWYPFLDKDELSEANFRRVGATYPEQGIRIAALCGAANLFDPRPDVRKAERDRLSLTLRLAPASGCPVVTTESGTLNPLKAGHPDNTKPEIWHEFVDVVGAYLIEAERAGSLFTLESYTKNVCRDARDVARLLKELSGSTKALRFVMDPFNVVYENELPHQRPVIENYFKVEGDRCVVAHAKDLIFEAGEKATPRAGTGVFDWTSYAELLHHYQPKTPLILEHLKWAELEPTLAFVREKLRQAGG